MGLLYNFFEKKTAEAEETMTRAIIRCICRCHITQVYPLIDPSEYEFCV